jgi:hypothetical protein
MIESHEQWRNRVFFRSYGHSKNIIGIGARRSVQELMKGKQTGKISPGKRCVDIRAPLFDIDQYTSNLIRMLENAKKRPISYLYHWTTRKITSRGYEMVSSRLSC